MGVVSPAQARVSSGVQDHRKYVTKVMYRGQRERLLRKMDDLRAQLTYLTRIVEVLSEDYDKSAEIARINLGKVR